MGISLKFFFSGTTHSIGTKPWWSGHWWIFKLYVMTPSAKVGKKPVNTSIDQTSGQYWSIVV